jgi:ADP-ribose pyrophosphatase YjhB (NUDIX family)
MIPERFNVRVYGLLIQNGKVLITDEIRFGKKMTKFPGGGLEFGEGLKECLCREFEEELCVKIKVGEFLYINDSFQTSSFDPKDQLLSVYYFVELISGEILATEIPFNFETDEPQCFRWVSLNKLVENDFTFPIDKKVIYKIKN